MMIELGAIEQIARSATSLRTDAIRAASSDGEHDMLELKIWEPKRIVMIYVRENGVVSCGYKMRDDVRRVLMAIFEEIERQKTA